MNQYKFCSFEQVTKFMYALPQNEQVKIQNAIDLLTEKDFSSVRVKTLRGSLKELIVKKRRFIFCIENNTIYFLRAFTKKTAKTPKQEIRISEQIHKHLLQQLQANS